MKNINVFNVFHLSMFLMFFISQGLPLPMERVWLGLGLATGWHHNHLMHPRILFLHFSLQNSCIFKNTKHTLLFVDCSLAYIIDINS